ncbi:MAG TPA: hypothetical protein V6C52_13865 [Coleofasciculaceae cyanobacterium]|jgi:hypothetical protein
MRNIALILNVLGLISILTGGAVLSYLGAFGYHPVGLVLITGSLG